MRPFVGLSAILLVLVFTTCETTTDLSELTEGSAREALTELAHADSIYLALRGAQGMPAAAQAALAHLQSYEGTEAAGISPDSSVWVFFRNGLAACVYEPPLEGLAAKLPDSVSAPVHVADGGEVIARSVAVLPCVAEFGSGAEEQSIGKLDTCFGGPQPATEVFRNAEVTVSAVKEILIAGPGVLFWFGHGVLMRDSLIGGLMTCLMLGENYPTVEMARQAVQNYAAQLKAGNRELVIVAHKGRHYLAITPDFVWANAQFDYMEGLGTNATKSLAFVCACFSALQCDDPISLAFESGGVDAYVGWDWIVSAGFARGKHGDFFSRATDTFSISQAFGMLGGLTDPTSFAGRSATLNLLGGNDPDAMIRAQMRFKHGGDLHGYAVGVTAHEVTSVACFAGDPLQQPKYAVTVNFPGNGPGSWNCTTDDDAEILVTDIAAARYYYVGKDLKGVNGTIDAERYDGSALSGRFSGTLGWWQPPHDPHEDPPDATFELEDGFFKQTGMRL